MIIPIWDFFFSVIDEIDVLEQVLSRHNGSDKPKVKAGLSNCELIGLSIKVVRINYN